MNKTAEAALEKPITDDIAEAIEEAKADSDLNFLKKQKEDEIRMRLDQFAKELSQVKKQRDQQKLYALVQYVREDGDRKRLIHEYFGLPYHSAAND